MLAMISPCVVILLFLDERRVQKNFRRTLFKVNNVQVTTITKSKSVSFSFLSRPTDPVLLLIFYLQQEIKVEWPNVFIQLFQILNLFGNIYLQIYIGID